MKILVNLYIKLFFDLIFQHSVSRTSYDIQQQGHIITLA